MPFIDIFRSKKKKIETGNQLTMLNGRVQLISVDSRKYIENGLMRNASLYSIIVFLARKFATIPLYEYNVRDQKALRDYKMLTSGFITKEGLDHARLLKIKALDEADESSELGRLLKRPNSQQGQSAFFELLYTFKLLTGDSFIYANHGDWMETQGKPIALHVMPSQYMNIVGDGTLWGVAYYYFQILN
jgi:phage portal protein BeeE